MAKVRICDLKNAISSVNVSDITDELALATNKEILEKYKDSGRKSPRSGLYLLFILRVAE